MKPYTIPHGLVNTWIGLDHMLTTLESFRPMVDNYPPYSILRVTEDEYRLELALAGFKKDEITVTAEDGKLLVKGSVAADKKADESTKATYIHQGIAKRSFVREFVLSEYMEVDSADLSDGLLTVILKRVVPDAKKPRKIPLGEKSPGFIRD